MINYFRKKGSPGSALLSVALLLGLSAGTALASAPAHDSIILRGPTGVPIDPKAPLNNAFSAKMTCGECHNGAPAGTYTKNGVTYTTTKKLLSYEELERHNYHTQLGSNEIKGFGMWNPDGIVMNPLTGEAVLDADGKEQVDPFKLNPNPQGKNWIQGPGHVGAWCAPSARQPARMFKDANGIYYDWANARIRNVPFSQLLTGSALTGSLSAITAYTPWNFTSATGLERAADITVVGAMMDCGECHVGGGIMEYIPNTADPQARIPYRDNATGATVTDTGGFLSGLYTTFNWFIDIFGDRGDVRRSTPSYAAREIDFAKSGVLEMDCLVCHLKDYNWQARRDAVRIAKFDASRAIGAGIAAFGTYTTLDSSGRSVVYDTAKVVFLNSTTQMKLASSVVANIKGTPDAANCASCHFATAEEKWQVEWKKRGDFWGASEVHTGIGCLGCHQRKDLDINGKLVTANIGTSGSVLDKKLGQCDPAKGGDCDFDGQWNNLDKVAFKNCNDCHRDSSLPYDPATGLTYGAPNAEAAHKAAGLTAKIVQMQFNANGERISNGIANASHIQIIDCTACHSRKLDEGAFRITGGAMTDGTGPDEQGRLATHDTHQVEREMKDNIGLYWKNGKLQPMNFMASSFWRDNNSVDVDANADTRIGGMDALMQTHIARINQTHSTKRLTEDGVVTAAEITTHQNNIVADLRSLIGDSGNQTDNPILLRLSFMGIPFKVSHNVAPGVDAWGADGCSDCHSAGNGFYNSDINPAPNTTFNYGANQMANFTKVNGSADTTDFHPATRNKAGTRSVAGTFVDPTTATSTTLRSVNKSETIYEGTFKNRDFSWKTTIQGAAPAAAGFYSASDKTTATNGRILKIEVKNDTTGAVTTRTFLIGKADYTTINQLVTHMGTFATGFEFTITGVDLSNPADGTNDALRIVADAGYSIRLNPFTDVGPLGLAGQLWVTEKVRPVGAPADGSQDKAGRTEWVSYLNTLSNAAAFGIGIDPVASIGPIEDRDPVKLGIQVVKDDPITVSAAANAGFPTYAWAVTNATVTGGDTPNATVTFTGNGSQTITLTVSDEEGKVRTTTATVDVLAAAPMDLAWADNAGLGNKSGTLTIANLPATANKVKIYWGDGTTTTKTTALTTANHTYVFTGNGTISKLVKVYAYNGTVQVGYTQEYITIDGGNL